MNNDIDGAIVPKLNSDEALRNLCLPLWDGTDSRNGDHDAVIIQELEILVAKLNLIIAGSKKYGVNATIWNIIR